MVSRSTVLSLVVAAAGVRFVHAASSSNAPRHLRSSNSELETVEGFGTSSEDVTPDLADTRQRSLGVHDTANWMADFGQNAAAPVQAQQALEEAKAKREIKQGKKDVENRKCLNTLEATANKYSKLTQSEYFTFTDVMSNGYYSFNNIKDYSGLDIKNKFAFVTLACLCHAFGGSGNCCQGRRANLDVSGIDAENPASMNPTLMGYINDICKTTSDAIGENVLPPTGELPTPPAPTVVSPPFTPKPTPPTPPAVEVPSGLGPTNGEDSQSEKLSAGAWVGMAIAAAGVITLIALLVSNRRKDDTESVQDDDLDDMSAQNVTKEMRAIDPNCELDEDRPERSDSPDATNSMTMSDVSSIPSMATGTSQSRLVKNVNAYYANNSLLPTRPDDESMLSSSDGPSFFTDESAGEGVEVGGGDSSTGGSSSLDQAIESGNWEAVAASAARMVKQNEEAETGVEV